MISVRVKPGSRKGPLVETDDDGTLVVYVREPAVEARVPTFGGVRGSASMREDFEDPLPDFDAYAP